MAKWLLAAIALALAGWFFWLKPTSSAPRLKIGSGIVNVEIRDDDSGRNLGLSGREALDENKGMLFIFDQPAVYEFWMKEMNFPLDFVWINDGKVVDLSERIPPPTKIPGAPPMTVRPSAQVNWVLEVNSGWVEKNKIKVGDSVLML